MGDCIDLKTRPTESTSIPEVAKAAQQACASNPACPRSHAVHAWAMNAMRRPSEALLSVDSGLRALSADVFRSDSDTTTDTAEATAVALLQNRGLAHLQLGDWIAAVAAYEHAEQLQPTAKVGKMIERAYQCSAAATLAKLTGEVYFWKESERKSELGDRAALESEAVTLLCAAPMLADSTSKSDGASDTSSDDFGEKECNYSPSGVDEFGEALHPYSRMWQSSSSSSDESDAPSRSKRKRKCADPEPAAPTRSAGRASPATHAFKRPALALPSGAALVDERGLADPVDTPQRRSCRTPQKPVAAVSRAPAALHGERRNTGRSSAGAPMKHAR